MYGKTKEHALSWKRHPQGILFNLDLDNVSACQIFDQITGQKKKITFSF